MLFRYPDKPDDWQTAYTRDHAYRDSGKHSEVSSLVLLAGTLLLWAYVLVRIVPIITHAIDTKKYQSYVWIILAVLLFVILFLVMAVVQMGAIRFASSFFREFYRPPEGADIAKIINYRLYGRMKLPPPLNLFFQFEYIIAKDGEIDKPDKWTSWAARHIGGPILLIVFDGCALYLERGNRFSRVVGPGDKAPFLEWYETIKYVVDLRPKVKTDSFDVWTKDGIKLKLTARIECRVGDPSKYDPASGLVYPFDPVAVKKAVERFALRWPNPAEEPSEFTWVDAAWGQVTGIVPGYIGSRMLDDLLIADRRGGQILSPDAVAELVEKLNNATKSFGVYLTDFQIQKIDSPDEVGKNQKENWKAEKQGVVTVKDGEAKAFSIRTSEKARADAQRDLILAIAEGLEKTKDGQFTEPLLISLSGVLDESLHEPLTRAYLAKETLDTLEKLQGLLGNKTQWEEKWNSKK